MTAHDYHNGFHKGNGSGNSQETGTGSRHSLWMGDGTGNGWAMGPRWLDGPEMDHGPSNGQVTVPGRVTGPGAAG